MNAPQRQFIIIGGALILVIIIALIFIFGRRPPSPPELTLNIWGIEPKSNLEPLIEAYKKLRPNVKINYEWLSETNYYQKVLDALASGSGPDIFMIKSKSLLPDISKIYPLPQTQFNLSSLRSLFPQVVEDDFVYQKNIYALPLYIDSLALFYNKDYFNKAAIVYPPSNWDELSEISRRLKTLDMNGNIVRAGAALGFTEKNIRYAPQILKLLMKQAGIPLFDNSGNVNLNSQNETAAQILEFYSSFANSKTINYTWTRDFPDSFDSFSQEKVAMIFGYQKDIEQVLNKNPYLNLGIAPMPQLKEATLYYAYADYWAWTVSIQSKNPAWAWDFIISITTNTSLADSYIQTTKKPPALKPLISKYLSDPELGVFASQSLISRSWPEINSSKINEIFNSAIENVYVGKMTPTQAIKSAEEQIGQVLRNY